MASELDRVFAEFGLEVEYDLKCDVLPCVAVVEGEDVHEQSNELRDSLVTRYAETHPDWRVVTSGIGYRDGRRVTLFTVDPEPGSGVPASIQVVRDELLPPP